MHETCGNYANNNKVLLIERMKQRTVKNINEQMHTNKKKKKTKNEIERVL